MTTPLRVLLVEDTEADAALVLRELERGGFAPVSKRVAAAPALAEALAQGPWDLIIADYTMPQFGGGRALAMVRDAGVDIPFIFVSGTLGDEAALAAIEEGARDFVPKTDLKRLLFAVQREVRELRLRRERGRKGPGPGELTKEVDRRVREKTSALLAANEALEEENLRLRRAALASHEASPQLPPLSESPPAILLVDDLPENLLALEAILGDLGAEIRKAASGEEALQNLLRYDFAAVLLDVRMPGMTGIEAAEIMRKRERSRHTPIIFLTANYDHPADAVRGYDVGAVDYIAKPFVPEILKAKVRVFLELSRKTQELRRHAQACDELNKELETFSSSVSHDLRAPLRAISGFGQALLEDYGRGLDPGAREYLDRMMASAKRMDSLIQELLAYAHVTRQQFTLRKIELDDAVTELVTDWTETIRSKQGEVRVERPLQAVLGQAVILKQVLGNLLGNALKFARPGVPPQIRLRSERRGAQVRLWVEDNGIGIPPEAQKRLFQPFERLHPSGEYEGTGLGLAIVRKAMEKMGGRAGVESEAGKGSRFWVEFRAP